MYISISHRHNHTHTRARCRIAAAVSGGLDKLVKWFERHLRCRYYCTLTCCLNRFDFSAYGDEGRVIGQHNEAVRCVEYTQALGKAA